MTEAQVDAYANNNGYLSTEIDGSVTNEIQDLSLASNLLSITGNTTATSIDLSGYLDNTNLTEAQVDAYANNNGYANEAATNAAIAVNTLDITALETLADGKIYLGNGSNEASEVTLSGDVTISNTGATTIGTLADLTVTNAIAGSVTGTSANVTGIVAIANGGTGSSTQNFVDITTAQTVAGAKIFSNDLTVNGITIGKGSGTGTGNTATGYNALSSNTTGDYNTALGYTADVGAGNLTNATALGYGALVTASNTIQLGNTSVIEIKTSGTITAGAITIPNIDGTANQVLKTDGSGVLGWATVSSGASAIDGLSDAKLEGTNFTGSMLLGHQTTGTLNGAEYNVGVGLDALDAITSGDYNTAIGYEALTANTIGSSNNAFGTGSLKSNTSGIDNVAIGYNALNSNTNGSYNVAIGRDALQSQNYGGWGNIAVGNNSLRLNASGSHNTAIGWGSLRHSSTAINNSAVGYESLYKITTGISNVALGWRAGWHLRTGDQNIIIGYQANTSLNNSVNETVIGSNLTGLGSNTITLGNADVTAIYMAQDRGAKVFAGEGDFSGDITTAGNVYTSSDIRLKKDIVNLSSSIDNIKSLRPVTYSKRSSLSSEDYGTTEVGFIAQELQKIYPNMVNEDDSKNSLLSVRYMELIPVLIKGMQEQQQMIEQQQMEIDGLKEIIGSTLPSK